jgi:hypothetical protein
VRTDLCFSRPTNSGGAGLGDGHQNGAVLWQFTNVSTIGLTAPVSATTTHVGPGGGVVGKVFVMSGGMQSKLYALDAQTGAMLWASDHVVGAYDRPPALSKDQRTVIAAAAQGVYTFAAATGSVLGRALPPPNPSGLSAPSPNGVAVSSDGATTYITLRATGPTWTPSPSSKRWLIKEGEVRGFESRLLRMEYDDTVWRDVLDVLERCTWRRGTAYYCTSTDTFINQTVKQTSVNQSNKTAECSLKRPNIRRGTCALPP